MNQPFNILLKSLLGEDKKSEIENKENPIQFVFKNQDYLFHLTNISSWSQRPHMRRIQLRSSLIDKLIKYHRYYVFGIFGYDNDTDTFTNWSSNYLQGSFSTKSLYTYEKHLHEAVDHGISKNTNKDNKLLTSVHFQSKYLAKYLQNFKSLKLNLRGEEIELKTFDHYHSNVAFQRILKSIGRHHTLSYLSEDGHKISDKWDREEYIITLDLYFRLQKNDRSKSAFSKKDPLVLDVYEFLKFRSKQNKTVVRNLSSLSLRHGNYQYADPEYKGLGLEGGGKNSLYKKIFDEFLHKQELLSKAAKNIRKKYNFDIFQETLINVREYIDQDFNLKRSISTSGLDEEEIRNKQEKAKSIHIKTVNILANYLRQLGLSPLEEPQTFDLFAYNKEEAYLFEVKSISKKNFRTQVRHALIQLEEYSFRHKKNLTPGFNLKISKFIVFDRNPYNLVDMKLIDFYYDFTKKRGIKIMYVDNGIIRKS